MFNNAFANSVRSAPAFSFALAAAALTLLTGTALARNTLASGDFDNDGFMDLVIGIPGENVQTVSNAGAVEVFFGSGVALTVLGDQYRHQNKPGFNDQTEVNDLFGNAVAVGDFNNDGFDDLAIGIPFEDVSGVVDAGAIAVIYGDASGVLSPDDQFWHQDSPGMINSAEIGDQLGSNLVTGDFDGDGFDDLAISVARENLPTDSPGAVHIMYGSAAGLTAADNQIWHQDSPGIDQPGPSDWFGDASAVGDFDNDGFDDLAIGVPFQEVAGVSNAGGVHIIYGSAAGLTAAGNQFWTQDSPGIANQPHANDNFGHALAAGDFNNDGRDDLAIGVPSEDVGIELDAGAVHVLYGNASGLVASGSQLWHQNSTDVLGDPDGAGHFGLALTAGDFDGDAFDDLAIGIPNQEVPAAGGAGAVHVLYGSGAKLDAAGNQVWHQDVAGIKEVAADLDLFGANLTAGDFNGDGRFDLAISVHGEDIAGVTNGGVVQVLYGKATTGLAAAKNQIWHQDEVGGDVHDFIEPDDFFGGVPPGF